MSFGVLTLATPSDYLKAIGLALSLRLSNPGTPVAIACSPRLRPLVQPYFDHVIDEEPGLRGFVHKVYLDRYTPFDETFFLDSDVLVFRSLKPYVEKWAGWPYTACGLYQADGTSNFGLRRADVLRVINKPSMVKIDGAGHALFRKPACIEVFDKAREVTKNYRDYVGDIMYADEDVMAIVMTMMDLQPMPYEEFFARYLSAQPGTMKMDVVKGECRFIAKTTQQAFSPCMVHFADNEAPLAYTRQLVKLYRHFNVPINKLLHSAVDDVLARYVKKRIPRKMTHFARALLATPGK